MTQKEGMHPALILRTILVSISLLLVPYLCYRFWILRNHFFIESRHPKVTIISSISMLITTTTLIGVTYFEFFLHGDEQILWSYNFTGAVGQGFAFVFCALIIFRAYLVYDQWKTSQMKLDNIVSILSKDLPRADSIKDRQEWFTCIGNTKISKDKLYKIVITFIFAIFVLSTCLYYRRNMEDLVIMVVIWLITLIVGTGIIIATRKTKEV